MAPHHRPGSDGGSGDSADDRKGHGSTQEGGAAGEGREAEGERQGSQGTGGASSSEASQAEAAGEGRGGRGSGGGEPEQASAASSSEPHEFTQEHRLIAVGTPLGPDALLLRGVSGTEELGRLFHYELDLLSTDEEIDFDQIVGHNVTVRIETTKEGVTRYINGLVSRFSQSRRTGRLASYRATIVPWLWLLTRTSDCRIFQDMNVPDIIKQIMRDHGLTDFDDRLTGTYQPWEYCVQYRETDFNFVSRLMEQEGICYYFEHENGKHTLVFCDAPTTHQPFGGYETISYRPPEQTTTDIEHIRDWRVEKQVEPGVYVHDDFDFKNPRKALEAQSRISRAHVASEFEIYDYPGEYTEFSDGERYARVRMEEFGAQHHVAGGSGDSRGICVGYKFTLEDYPREDQCGEYLVTSTSLNAQSDEFVSGGGGRGGGTFLGCTFTVIPADVQFRPARITPKPLIHGPQTAIVVGPAGEEIYTDEHGRVKVQFHWDRRSAGDETSSCWIRVAQAWAGKKWGAMFIPRIGQEVIVECLEADPDKPIITGRVYNGEAPPPYDLPTHKTRSTVKSNSSKGGQGYNEIRYEDKKGEEQIYIHAEKDEDIRVENKCRELILNDRHLIVGCEKDGAKQGSQHEMVYVDKHIKVHRNHTEHIGGDMQLLVGGIDGPGDVDIVIKGESAELIEKDCHVHVKGNRKEKVDVDQSLTVGNNQQEKVGMNHALDAGQSIHLKGGMTVVIEAGMQLTIKGPGGFVDIGPSGVTIQGTLVKINSGGAAGTGGGSSPSAPADASEASPVEPAVADTATAGEVDQGVAAASVTPATYSDAAKVMKQAAEDGTPFCEECERARREAEEEEKRRREEEEGGDDEKKGKGAEGTQAEDWEKKDKAPAYDDDWEKKGKGAEGVTQGGYKEGKVGGSGDVTQEGPKGKGAEGKW
ncbi:MAG: type VI secretion system tip protein VgrG [Planctomycetes bacterium]|nr:type VI secretion system tip protein VgrG [Planctomycetota bacterium]